MKKYLAVVVLIGLVIWGMYDVGNKSKNPSTLSNSAGVSTNANQGRQATVGLEKGNLAPDFELGSIDGKATKLSSLRGKKVILNFWATWCPPCRLEMPEMEKFYTENKNEGLEIIAVNLTKAEKSRADVPPFIKADAITFPVLMDENGDAAQLYEISSIPASFIIDTQGVIQDKIVGPMTINSMQEMVSALK
jgi:peroxiredoxin